ncbi:UNVERIFIED_CONTAM: hypothetical protein Sradi_0540000 [Sesamum radiatum]|uniref:Phytocyanin domain-containing protein n=1 Tax=Sesamum radiatum TaxID=300843 RepID=A0AAW2VJV5_SESRA
MAELIACVLLLLISPAAYAATTHTVGGLSGWNTGIDYGNWASGQTFATRDTLLFNYDTTHAVSQVTEADYQNCSTENVPIYFYSSSPTSIPLTAVGTSYFICPRSNHCSQGMKLAVTVTMRGSSPPSFGDPIPLPPSDGASPSPPSGSPETPGTPPSTPSSPPPPAGGSAASILGSKNSLMAGFSLVLEAVVGVMGEEIAAATVVFFLQ